MVALDLAARDVGEPGRMAPRTVSDIKSRAGDGRVHSREVIIADGRGMNDRIVLAKRN